MGESAPRSPGDVPSGPGAPGARAWWTVAVLTLAYAFAFVDRQVITVLVGPIQADLGIGDTAISLLMGLSFAIFYTLVGVLLGPLADSRSRRGLAAFGFAFWSAMTAACGIVKSFGGLFLARMGVGVGEAALSPAAYSMIADEFPRERRATALGVYSSGIYLGSSLAIWLGGPLSARVGAAGDVELPILGVVRPWQAVFLLLGATGLIASLLFASVREPARRAEPARGNSGGEVRPTRAVVFAFYREHAAWLTAHHLGFALLSLAGYAAAAWIPTMLARRHGFDPATVGNVYGPIVLVFGIAGVVCGGRAADLAKRAGVAEADLRVALVAALLLAPLGAAFPLASDARLACVLLAAFTFASSLPWGVAASAIAEHVPDRLRGSVSAIYLFAINAIGLGLGPTLPALITDYVHGDRAALHLSLAWTIPTVELLAAMVIFAGVRHRRFISPGR